jgi:hypothetical protein
MILMTLEEKIDNLINTMVFGKLQAQHREGQAAEKYDDLKGLVGSCQRKRR